MEFLSKIFGGKEKTEQKVEIKPVEYKGFDIYQDAIAESGQYRVAGRIEKEFGGEIKTHRFIRSDVVSNKQDADELMLKKSQMFIDQMGDNIFS